MPHALDIPGSTVMKGGTGTCLPSWSFPMLREAPDSHQGQDQGLAGAES